MNFNHILFSRIAISRLFIALAALLLLSCEKPNPSNASATSEYFSLGRPLPILSATEFVGGMCPIDRINNQLLSDQNGVSKNLPFSIEGWSVIESKEQPVPSLVYIILQGASGDFYLEAKRKSRPDVAKGDSLLELAGFEIAGYLSSVPTGQYLIKIATGSGGSIIVCDTKVRILISE